MRFKFFFRIFIFAFLLLSPVLLRAEEKPSLEEIAKTPAAKLFIEKKYDASLQEFLKIEKEYPGSVIIKRYLASLYTTLGNWNQAISKLQEALQLNPNDLIARQMAGDIYIRQANFDQAQNEFKILKEKDPEGRFGDYAAKRIETIRQMAQVNVTEKGKRLSTQDFMKSEAAQTFAKGDFKKALQDLDQLILDYPDDPLVYRFRGITLMRLNQNKEAAEALKGGVQKFPENVAMHYYLGQAYLSLQNMEEARKEFRWVIEHDESGYKMKAQQGMFLTLGGAAAKPQKPWSVSFSQAYEYDTNAIYKSTDVAYRVPGDQNSGRYATLMTGTYQAFHRGRWFLIPDMFYAQNLYDHFPNLNTYSPGLGVSALYGFSFFGKPTFINVREGGSATYLKRSIYVLSNTLSTSLISNVTKRMRSNFTHRWTYSNFNLNGPEPVLTDRDGNTHGFSFSNTHYFNEAKNFYGSYGYDFEHAGTRGRNYIKNMHGFRTAVHFPIIEKIEGDITLIFKNSDYPKYDSAPPQRRDSVYTLTTTLSRPLWQWLSLNLIYTFEDSRARNNAYEYFRHVFSVKLAAQY